MPGDAPPPQQKLNSSRRGAVPTDCPTKQKNIRTNKQQQKAEEKERSDQASEQASKKPRRQAAIKKGKWQQLNNIMSTKRERRK